jgi:hypothetical protein
VDAYDAYIVHASEDSGIASMLAEALRLRGLRIWCNSFRVGVSIRTQMEGGLASSSVGVVVVTPNLFTKRWASEELDGLYALEVDPDVPRIFPLWVGVTPAQVRELSPMLAMRRAIVSSDPETVDVEAVSQLADSIVHHCASGSKAQYLRAQIKRGLAWSVGPEFLTRSLQVYDEQSEDFALLSLAHYPDAPPDGFAGQPAPLSEFLRAPMAYDGSMVTAIGRQTDGSQQVLEVHDFQLGSHQGQPVKLASHVFQLHSVEFNRHHTCYVHCFGPYHSDLSPRVPPDRLCWVTGLILAYGSVQTVQGATASGIYIAARAMYSTPADQA